MQGASWLGFSGLPGLYNLTEKELLPTSAAWGVAPAMQRGRICMR